jgi:hypothetical protein
LEAAGQTVSKLQLAVHALRGLPKGYETLREILEAGKIELSLDTVQPKLMLQEQTLKLQAESKPAEMESAKDGQAAAFMAKRRYHGSSGAGKGSSTELRASSELRSCYECGEIGHIKLNCRFCNADYENCGKRGHTRAVSMQTASRWKRAGTIRKGERRRSLHSKEGRRWRTDMCLAD